MRIDWSAPAVGDLAAAGAWIAAENPQAAARMSARVREAVETLVDFPTSGRPGRVPGTRELVISATPFVLVYRIRPEGLQILRLLHHARRWP